MAKKAKRGRPLSPTKRKAVNLSLAEDNIDLLRDLSYERRQTISALVDTAIEKTYK